MQGLWQTFSPRITVERNVLTSWKWEAVNGKTVGVAAGGATAEVIVLGRASHWVGLCILMSHHAASASRLPQGAMRQRF